LLLCCVLSAGYVQLRPTLVLAPLTVTPVSFTALSATPINGSHFCCIELLKLFANAVPKLSAVQSTEDSRLRHANGLGDALLGHTGRKKGFHHFSDRGCFHVDGINPSWH